MNCRGKFKFRGLAFTEAGTFVNDEGKSIPYNASYKLKLDEITDDGVVERVYKVAQDSTLIPQLNGFKIYDDIVLDFEVQQYSNSCRLIPISIVNNK